MVLLVAIGLGLRLMTVPVLQWPYAIALCVLLSQVSISIPAAQALYLPAVALSLLVGTILAIRRPKLSTAAFIALSSGYMILQPTELGIRIAFGFLLIWAWTEVHAIADPRHVIPVVSGVVAWTTIWLSLGPAENFSTVAYLSSGDVVEYSQLTLVGSDRNSLAFCMLTAAVLALGYSLDLTVGWAARLVHLIAGLGAAWAVLSTGQRLPALLLVAGAVAVAATSAWRFRWLASCVVIAAGARILIGNQALQARSAFIGASLADREGRLSGAVEAWQTSGESIVHGLPQSLYRFTTDSVPHSLLGEGLESGGLYFLLLVAALAWFIVDHPSVAPRYYLISGAIGAASSLSVGVIANPTTIFQAGMAMISGRKTPCWGEIEKEASL